LVKQRPPGKTADLKYKMAEVTSALADAKNALTDAQVELRDKDAEIERLQKAFARTDETVEHRGKYYRKKPDGTPMGRPFCTVCWEQGRLFLLDKDMKGMRGAMKCANCKAQFDMLPEFGEPE
jgi:hypothetical protein